MAKLIKNKYYTSKGEEKVNNYLVAISKTLIKESGINPENEVKAYVKDNKIVIENDVSNRKNEM